MSKVLKMFGIIVSGRLVETNILQMNQNQFLITVPDADNVNHVVVFLTGSIPFPEGTGGAGLWWGTLLVTPVKYIKTGCCRCPTPAGLSLSINNEVDQLAMAMTLSILDLCNLESRKNHPLPGMTLAIYTYHEA
ncbi:uncharacterized protein LOC107044727 isoform X4 [Diachasma alloeum]|uniref:uncharacterized protein LOC107044727 isoform X4 n=1 Tax=Diachasma alloeum TaxID=454923 RepID=UPI00073844AD|nr:uncharacterized protein LOC107044727 isoform X4 [Diachasma alloeum]